MNNYTFTDKGIAYKRISKKAAEGLYNAGIEVIACPCKLRPFGF